MAPIRHLFPIFAVVGLILTPIARPAMALAQDMHAAMVMPADMPCCPDQVPMPDCAKDCPFMAMCAAQFVCSVPHGAGLVVALAFASIVVPGNDTDVAGLSQGPPPRPPKI